MARHGAVQQGTSPPSISSRTSSLSPSGWGAVLHSGGGGGAGVATAAASASELSVVSCTTVPPAGMREGAAAQPVVPMGRTKQRRTKRSGMGTPRHSDSVMVAVRLRPMLRREIANNDDNSVAIKANSCHVRAVRHGKSKQTTVTVDHAITPESTQQDIYDKIGKQLVDNAWRGYNSSLLAYGQTGSGKTYSVFGPHEVASQDLYALDSAGAMHCDAGLIPRAFQDIFDRIELSQQDDYIVEVAMMEVFLERVFDLLRNRAPMDLRGTNELGFFPEKLTKKRVCNFRDVVQILTLGNSQKVVAATLLNQSSSRAHTIIEIYVRKLVNDSSSLASSSKITIVDLAGSENVKQSAVKGELLVQASNINLSLMELGKVVEQVVDSAQHPSNDAPDSAAPSPRVSPRASPRVSPAGTPSLAPSVSPRSTAADLSGVADGPTHSGTTGSVISFRGSALTKLLKESIGGNSKATILVTISPSQSDAVQTVNALRFADRAKHLRNHARFNEGAFSEHRTRMRIMNEEHKTVLERHQLEKDYIQLLNRQAKIEQDAAALRQQQRELAEQIAEHTALSGAERAQLRERREALHGEEKSLRGMQRDVKDDIEHLTSLQAAVQEQRDDIRREVTCLYSSRANDRLEIERLEQELADALSEGRSLTAHAVHLTEEKERLKKAHTANLQDMAARCASEKEALRHEVADTYLEEVLSLRLSCSRLEAQLGLEASQHSAALDERRQVASELRDEVGALRERLKRSALDAAAAAAAPPQSSRSRSDSPSHSPLSSAAALRESRQLLDTFEDERERLKDHHRRETRHLRTQADDLSREIERLHRQHSNSIAMYQTRLRSESDKALALMKDGAAERDTLRRERRTLVAENEALRASVVQLKSEAARLSESCTASAAQEHCQWAQKNEWRIRCQDLAAKLRTSGRLLADMQRLAETTSAELQHPASILALQRQRAVQALAADPPAQERPRQQQQQGVLLLQGTPPAADALPPHGASSAKRLALKGGASAGQLEERVACLQGELRRSASGMSAALVDSVCAGAATLVSEAVRPLQVENAGLAATLGQIGEKHARRLGELQAACSEAEKARSALLESVDACSIPSPRAGPAAPASPACSERLGSAPGQLPDDEQSSFSLSPLPSNAPSLEGRSGGGGSQPRTPPLTPSFFEARGVATSPQCRAAGGGGAGLSKSPTAQQGIDFACSSGWKSSSAVQNRMRKSSAASTIPLASGIGSDDRDGLIESHGMTSLSLDVLGGFTRDRAAWQEGGSNEVSSNTPSPRTQSLTERWHERLLRKSSTPDHRQQTL